MFLSCLARLRGYPVKIIHTSGFRHRGGNSLGGGKVIMNRLSTSQKRRTFSERNKNFVMALTYPTPFFQLIFPLHIVMLLTEGVLLSFLKRDLDLLGSIYISSIRSLWRERKRLYHLRNTIQSSRRISDSRFFSPFIPKPHKLFMFLRYGIPEIK